MNSSKHFFSKRSKLWTWEKHFCSSAKNDFECREQFYVDASLASSHYVVFLAKNKIHWIVFLLVETCNFTRILERCTWYCWKKSRIQTPGRINPFTLFDKNDPSGVSRKELTYIPHFKYFSLVLVSGLEPF